ncbi:hypothetical protein MMC30_002858 [Trapelia coarctata]|nr:hypothetical protein [Trapelia coarctata]
MFAPRSILQTLAVTLTALSTLTSSAPTPEGSPTLEKRTCATQGPSIIDVLRASTGDNASPGQLFTLDREGSPPYDTINSAITFEYIPPGATGCMLQLEFPPLTTDNQIASGTATQADVWSTKPWNNTNLPTYNHPPVKDQFVSTTIFPTQKSTTGTKTILVSNSCSPQMSFFFELSNWQRGTGTVNFFNSLGGKQGLQPIGFSMIYNC